MVLYDVPICGVVSDDRLFFQSQVGVFFCWFYDGCLSQKRREKEKLLSRPPLDSRQQKAIHFKAIARQVSEYVTLYV